MEPHIVELFRDRFDAVDAMLTRITVDLEEHSRLDRAYWKKLDAHETQLSMVKWFLGGLSSLGLIIIGWFFNHK